ncbi:hypothetical protein AAVH_26129 [Aphelenchoides avenae]|nr:hypothetical protein AAVH_26129 [Aphelenchus avenae]
MRAGMSTVRPDCMHTPSESPSLAAVRLADLLIKTSSVFLIAMNVPRFGCRAKPIPMHRNLKVLLLNFVLIYLLKIIATAALYFTRKVRVWTAVNGCIEPVIYRECIAINGVKFAATIGFTFAHFAVLIERTTAAYYAQRYENARPHLSCSLSLAMWIGICGWTYYVFSDDDPGRVIADCSKTPKLPSTHRWSMGQYYCLAADLAVSLADLSLLVVNKRQQSTLLENYTLRKSYQLKKNQLTTRIIFPCSIVHTVAFASYLAVNSSAYTFVGVPQPILDGTELVMGAYMYLTLAFFFWIRRRVSPKGLAIKSCPAVDDYFESFQRSIAYNGDVLKLFRKLSEFSVV